MHTGSCHCRAVRFEIEGDLAPIQVCHCGDCRKAQGGPFGTNIPVETSKFHQLSGADDLRIYDSTPDKERVFCGRCGGPLFSRLKSKPEVMRIRAGTLDGCADGGFLIGGMGRALQQDAMQTVANESHAPPRKVLVHNRIQL